MVAHKRGAKAQLIVEIVADMRGELSHEGVGAVLHAVAGVVEREGLGAHRDIVIV